ncbi:MAG TPA: FemAB family XrtA/PEP-CTERM system-associated protein [Gemmatimonadales bacterium]
MTFVCQVDPNGAWDDFVLRDAGATFCHLAGWRAIMTDVLRNECLYLAALDSNGEWEGALPLVRVRAPLLGHYLVSMPFLNAGGPIGSLPARLALADAAVAEAKRSGADLVELRARAAVPGDLRLSQRKITVTLPLPDAPDVLWESFSSKLKSQIRRPQKAGFEARFGAEHREAFYDVFARNMRTLGTPVLPADLFERLAVEFGDRVVFGVVYRGGEPVAAGCGFVWREGFELTWAASRREHSAAAPNMLLYWSFMSHLIARGVRQFDFGRCTPGGGTHRFKQQWGGADVPLPWAQWTSRNVTAPPTPERPVFRAAAACWRRLPLALTNAIGPIIARRLP